MIGLKRIAWSTSLSLQQYGEQEYEERETNLLGA